MYKDFGQSAKIFDLFLGKYREISLNCPKNKDILLKCTTKWGIFRKVMVMLVLQKKRKLLISPPRGGNLARIFTVVLKEKRMFTLTPLSHIKVLESVFFLKF